MRSLPNESMQLIVTSPPYNLGKSYEKKKTSNEVYVEQQTAAIAEACVIISRNEWMKAKQAGENYLFHIWDVRADKLYECGVDLINPHIPSDQGDGEWKDVTVPLRAVRR